MDPSFWLSLLIFIGSLGALAELTFGLRQIRSLADQSTSLSDPPPKLSFIFSALNEADTIEPALRSVLALDYPGLEVIAINDRSTDATGEILDRIAREQPRLKVLHIRELPPGWLGKNHALHRGAMLASGDYLLFSDADVVFASSAVRRAVTYCEQHRLDHLTVLPALVVTGALLRMLMVQFVALFFLQYKPWKLPSSRAHSIGSGAFNMVRRRAYLETGGHAAIPLAIIDDMLLGKLIGMRGLNQEALAGNGMVAVAWYRSVPAMFVGMRKNVFAAFDYRLDKLIGVTLFILTVSIWPWIGLFVDDDVTRLLNLGSLIAVCALYVGILRLANWSMVCLAYWPIISFVSLTMWWHGALLALIRGEIDWRGTRYSLADLRRSHLPIQGTPKNRP